MSTTGDLKDLGLTTLVQMLSMERRSVTLVLKRQREDGLIFFEQGEIFHARCGSLSGEEAVYHLLNWTEGTFMVSDEANLHTRSVRIPTNHLLLEAANRADESGAGAGGRSLVSRPLSPAETEHDNQLENDLTLLVSRLEQLQSQGNQPKRPAQLLQALAEMVNQTVAFIEQQPAPPGKGFSLPEAFEVTAHLYPAIRLLQLSANRLPAQTLLSFYNNWSGNASGRSQTFRQMAKGLINLLQSCFAHQGEAFHSPAAEKQWQETWQIFLADLSQVTEKIQF